MFGDCQVMSNLGGGIVSSETLFSPIENPNFNFGSFSHFPSFIPKEENTIPARGKEEMESGSGSEQVEDKSCNEQEISDDQPPKKKRYHRHTSDQIKQMETLFNECQHPDDKQRMRLSQELGLKPRQVKFWFQNKRTQVKALQDRNENVVLRAENDSLKNLNYQLQAELRNLICPSCGGTAVMGRLSSEELRLENLRLREKLDRVCYFASRPSSGTIAPAMPSVAALLPSSLDLDMNMFSRSFPDSLDTCSDLIQATVPTPTPLLPEASFSSDEGVLLMEEEKTLAMELAVSSLTELLKLCHGGEPLWIGSTDNMKETLNAEEHARLFSRPSDFKQIPCEMRTEASRGSVVVIMNSITLVDAFLDADKWMDLFPSIVAQARTVQIISSGVSGASGVLQLMYAEFQALSPLVPTRETYFLRFCQQNVEEESFTIVDFPMDNFRCSIQQPIATFRRFPSGCVIQDMPNGYSRVTWVEHVEVEEKPVHQIFSSFVRGGMAFGTNRWLTVLQSQCERLASLMATNTSDLGVMPSLEARKSLMRLSQRMTRTFFLNIGPSTGKSWMTSPESSNDTFRIMTRKIMEPSQPNGLILCSSSTTWLPYPHYHVFDLLRDEQRRSQIGTLSNGNALHEVAHIAVGSHQGDSISLLRIDVTNNSSQHIELLLQESCTDQSGSIIVYSPVSIESIQLAMSAQDPSCIPLLPMGFVIAPMASPRNPSFPHENSCELGDLENSGCLLTIGLQVLAATTSSKLTLSTTMAVDNQMSNMVNEISAILSSTPSATISASIFLHDKKPPCP